MWRPAKDGRNSQTTTASGLSAAASTNKPTNQGRHSKPPAVTRLLRASVKKPTQICCALLGLYLVGRLMNLAGLSLIPNFKGELNRRGSVNALSGKPQTPMLTGDCTINDPVDSHGTEGGYPLPPNYTGITDE